VRDDDPLASRGFRIRDTLRKEWIVTGFLPHTLQHQKGLYFGTVICIRKALVEHLGATLSVSADALPSQCDRLLHTLTLHRDGRPLLRIGTTHLDGAPIAVALRKAQLEVCARHLLVDADVPTILTGDFNNVEMSELDAILSPPYSLQDGLARFDTRPSYNTTYWLKGNNTQRIDFVLWSSNGWRIEAGKYLGEESVKLPKGLDKPKRVAPDGKVYPSDHLGVYVTAKWAP
jgi:endonuclease/exonuclease/phosphatase family metal-dependent hydrolase